MSKAASLEITPDHLPPNRSARIYAQSTKRKELDQVQPSTPAKKAKRASKLAKEIAGDSPLPMALLDPPKKVKQISKTQILQALKDTLHTTLSKLVLTDITFFEEGGTFNVLGRPKVDGSSTKQMRHILPYSFVSKLIEHVVEKSISSHKTFTALANILPIFIQNQKGFAISSEDQPSSKMVGSANRAMKTEDTITYLLSPKKAKFFKNKSTKEAAEDNFYKHNLQYIKTALHEFCNTIKEQDSNTAIMASEILSRFIFSIFNQAKNTAFATEGNTAPYEIRLYGSPEEALAGKKEDYEVVTVRELKEKSAKDITKCIRLANSEGARVKAIPKALSALDDIIQTYQIKAKFDSNLIQEYNSKYNFTLKLANYETNLSLYNKSIDSKNINELVEHHIAKLLYSVFDLTALEENRLIPYDPRFGQSDEKNIELYPSAAGKGTSVYFIGNGKGQRWAETNAARGYSHDEVYREEEVDQTLLAKKIVELFVIGMHPFTYLNTHFAEEALKKLTLLATMDHNIIDSQREKFIISTNDIYMSLSEPQIPAQQGDYEILGMNLSGEWGPAEAKLEE